MMQQICMVEGEFWSQGWGMDCGGREIKKKQEEQLGDQLVQVRLDMKVKGKSQSIGGKIDLME